MLVRMVVRGAGYTVAMTTRADLVAVVDLAERLQLVYDRNDEYPMRVLGEQLRAELVRLEGQLVEPDLRVGSLLDPSACDSDDLRSRTLTLIEEARRWERLERPVLD